MDERVICGIYKITSPTGKVYIGESKNIPSRIYYYKILSCRNQRKLYNSLLKYGWDAHNFEVVEECEVGELKCRERYWQDHYDVLGEKGLNLKLTDCGELKSEMSQSTKNKISLKNKGELNGMFGKTMSDDNKKMRRDYVHTEKSLALIQKRSYRGNNPTAKLVINLETGIFYGCVADASDSIGMKRDTLKQQLNGRRKNYTSFAYVDNYIKGFNPKKSERYILDTKNGIFYNTAREASYSYNYSYLYILKMLNTKSKVRNKTSLEYV